MLHDTTSIDVPRRLTPYCFGQLTLNNSKSTGKLPEVNACSMKVNKGAAEKSLHA